MTQDRPDWPYPALIAHRGAGRQAPENTLAAMRMGAAHGFMMMEYDVKLSRDGIALLLHDDTLDRTSNATGNAADKSWAELRSEEHTSELQSLMRISYAVFCLQKKKRTEDKQLYSTS